MRLKVLRDHRQPLSANPEGGCRSRPTSDEGHLRWPPRSLRCNRVHGQNDLTRFGLPANDSGARALGRKPDRDDETFDSKVPFHPMSVNALTCGDATRSTCERSLWPAQTHGVWGSSPNGENRPAAGEVRSRFVYRTTRTKPRERAPDASSEELDEAQ